MSVTIFPTKEAQMIYCHNFLHFINICGMWSFVICEFLLTDTQKLLLIEMLKYVLQKNLVLVLHVEVVIWVPNSDK